MSQSGATKAVGILISGRGSNMRALVQAAQAADFPARIAVVIANKAEAEGLDYARAQGIATAVIPSKGKSREVFDGELDAALRQHGVEIVCLAGFMRLLTAGFVESWRGRLLNIHPSLLPAFRGTQVHERVIESGARFTGCTVHFVVPEMDEGPIILQAAIAVPDDATPDTLAELVLTEEHRLYPLALRLLAEGRLRVEGNRVRHADGN
ncbi:phosphoribosylglycinamide formyltransferase [Ferrovibrio sp.]|uniref:phosphoribosylglycinamide formyltransferase n=1 Tax=Ferrovibrio sp. TaxID=1917215 RepID=UPI001B784F1E|nr:phosphoribosylglycinamide formyltransferase [Ferrovibrio sp.]MBP7064590.1 phosphoribosylglycinamide formyltransferase [Ferrovibrio sp.]